MNFINEDNFKNLDPAKLLEAKCYPEVEDMVVSVMAGQDPDYARDFALLLNSKLDKISVQLSQELLNKYLHLLKALQLSGLRAMGDEEKEIFFREKILDVFRLDFVDVRAEVETDFKAYFESPIIIEDWRKLFLSALEKNSQKLGTKPIQVLMAGADKMVAPTLQNWLSDYNSNQHVDPKLQKRTGFDQVNYIDHSKNVANLTKEERFVLQKVLQFYDWLKFDPLRYDFSLPGQPKEEEEMVNVEKSEDIFSPELVSALEKMRQQSEQKQSVPYINRQNFQLSQTTGQVQILTPAVQKPTNKIQPTLSETPSIISQKSAAAPSLMDIKTEIENKRRKAQEEIDKKLEELKRKIQK